MNTLIVSKQTSVDAIPLGRRIEEIMKAKGNYYTQVQMSARLKIGRETFRFMLKGQRDIYTFELDKIAKDLKVSKERILQEDIAADARMLETILVNREDPIRALEFAQRHEQIAIGSTEKCLALNRLAWALFDLKRFEEAHKYWLDAYEHAVDVSRGGDDEPLVKVTRNLMLSYLEMKEYVRALKLSEQIESFHDNEPEALLEIYYTRAIIKEQQGLLESAAFFAHKCLEHCLLIDSPMSGRGYLNVAHFEFKMGNYEMAKEYLEKAQPYFKSDRIYQVVAKKELAKTLLKLGDRTEAEMIVLSLLKEDILEYYPDHEGKLRVLHSEIVELPDQAEAIISDLQYSISVRYEACKFLMQYFQQRGDLEMVRKYHKLAEQF